MELTLDRASNRLVVNGIAMHGTRRWEALVLATLIDGGHRTVASACGATALGTLLASCGQPKPLTRKQWSLIWQSIRHMFAAANAGPELASRLCHAPRNVTVGPWWWAPQPGDRVALHGTAVEAAVLPVPRLSSCGSSSATATLCEQFLICQSLVNEGQLQAARDALAEDGAWRDTSPELQALRQLRLAEVEMLRRDFASAQDAMDMAQRLIDAVDVADVYLGSYLDVLRQRVEYIKEPTVAHTRILAALSPMIQRPSRARHREVDTYSRGLMLNLAALCERRWVEQHAGREAVDVLLGHADAAQRYWSAALFGFLASNQHEHVHNMCSNVAYLHQRLCDLGLQQSPETALEWYRLAQAWHNRFDLPDNTVWEYIFIGDFWLHRQDVRARLDVAAAQSSWAGRHPGSLEFYDYAVRRAREIGEPRQIAHTALNLWRFARLRGGAALIQRARAALAEILSLHPDLRDILTAEGYSLPKSY